jgi:hypothetical protein
MVARWRQSGNRRPSLPDLLMTTTLPTGLAELAVDMGEGSMTRREASDRGLSRSEPTRLVRRVRPVEAGGEGGREPS